MPFNRFDNYPMSWRPVLPKGNAPLYRLLAQQLEQDIASGNLLPGTKLPPQRELADFLDINLSTVSRAFNGSRSSTVSISSAAASVRFVRLSW